MKLNGRWVFNCLVRVVAAVTYKNIRMLTASPNGAAD